MVGVAGFVACLLVGMVLIDCCQQMTLGLQALLGLVFFVEVVHHHDCILLLVRQLCLTLQIVVVGCCTLVGIGVVQWFGRFAGGHMQWCVELPLPPHHGSSSSWPFGL